MEGRRGSEYLEGMNDDEAGVQRRNPRGSSPPDVPSELAREERRQPETRKMRDENRWTIWQAAYRLRRSGTLSRIIGSLLKGKM